MKIPPGVIRAPVRALACRTFTGRWQDQTATAMPLVLLDLRQFGKSPHLGRRQGKQLLGLLTRVMRANPAAHHDLERVNFVAEHHPPVISTEMPAWRQEPSISLQTSINRLYDRPRSAVFAIFWHKTSASRKCVIKQENTSFSVKSDMRGHYG